MQQQPVNPSVKHNTAFIPSDSESRDLRYLWKSEYSISTVFANVFMPIKAQLDEKHTEKFAASQKNWFRRKKALTYFIQLKCKTITVSHAFNIQQTLHFSRPHPHKKRYTEES